MNDNSVWIRKELTWKAADERLLAIERFHATGLLVELTDAILAIQHADELNLRTKSFVSCQQSTQGKEAATHHTLQQLAACTPRGAEDDHLTAKRKRQARTEDCDTANKVE
jgi:hypothetical protein